MDQHGNKELLTPGEMLEGGVDRGEFTRETIAASMGKESKSGTEAVRRMFLGQWPKLKEFRRMVSRSSFLPRAMIESLLAWFLKFSDYKAVYVGAIDRKTLDVNGSGDVDPADVSLILLKLDEFKIRVQTHMVTGGPNNASPTTRMNVRNDLQELEIFARQAGQAWEICGGPAHMRRVS